jgi:hypothetical protein
MDIIEFEKQIKNEHFLKNLKRMFITKKMEELNINQTIIKFDDATKSFDFDLKKKDRRINIKYKIKRKRKRKTNKDNSNKKLKNINDNIQSIKSKKKSDKVIGDSIITNEMDEKNKIKYNNKNNTKNPDIINEEINCKNKNNFINQNVNTKKK